MPEEQQGDDLQRYIHRRVQVTREVVMKFGATSGCKKCRGLVSNDQAYHFVHHT